MIMSTKSKSSNSNNMYESEIRRGPWTYEEDNLLLHYINCHGEGRWNSLAKFAGLNRTGKSCRLRWLNYLKPDIKRGNLTPQEQILILELHSKWGNKWSKIAQHLPGRTDNEIKNYWRTRVQKQARQLNIDSNSAKFIEALRAVWMPRLIEKIEQDSPLTSSSSLIETRKLESNPSLPKQAPVPTPCPPHPGTNPDNNSSSNSIQFENSIDDNSNSNNLNCNYYYHYAGQDIFMSERHVEDVDWLGEDLELGSSCWNTDELWQFRKQEKYGVYIHDI